MSIFKTTVVYPYDVKCPVYFDFAASTAFVSTTAWLNKENGRVESACSLHLAKAPSPCLEETQKTKLWLEK